MLGRNREFMDNPLYIKEVMHLATQNMLYPTMFILAFLLIYVVCVLGSVVIEAISERRHYRVSMPQLVAAIDSAAYFDLPEVIGKSGLLDSHVLLLQTLVAYGFLPENDRIALARKLLKQIRKEYTKTTSRTDLVSKVAPMVGLMGTLIPLGPGIVALGGGKYQELSASIEIAFDTTVAGLIVAAVCLLVSRWRKRWYSEYMDALEASMDAILEKAHECEAAGLSIGDEQRAFELSELIKRGARRAKPGRARAAAAPQVT